jgi:hypothetical protein
MRLHSWGQFNMSICRAPTTALLVTALAVTLAACGTLDRFKRTEPTVCPSSLKADIEAEPMAPEGVVVTDLPEGVAAWWFGEFIPWARGNALRLDQAKGWCEALTPSGTTH